MLNTSKTSGGATSQKLLIAALTKDTQRTTVISLRLSQNTCGSCGTFEHSIILNILNNINTPLSGMMLWNVSWWLQITPEVTEYRNEFTTITLSLPLGLGDGDQKSYLGIFRLNGDTQYTSRYCLRSGLHFHKHLY